MPKTSHFFLPLSLLAAPFLGASPAAALQDWTTVPAACAPTDNNFFSGTPSATLPVARFITPGGRLSFNGQHSGFIAVVCNVDNPQDQGTSPAWNQLEVTYDPDGKLAFEAGHDGGAYQVFVALVQQNTTTGVSTVIAQFDSNVDCVVVDLGRFCEGNRVRSFVKPFTHTFDFAHNAYAVFGQLFRSTAVANVITPKSVLIQMRLNAR